MHCLAAFRLYRFVHFTYTDVSAGHSLQHSLELLAYLVPAADVGGAEQLFLGAGSVLPRQAEPSAVDPAYTTLTLYLQNDA